MNGDGVDEVVISHLCLDANGKEMWNNAKYFEKNNDHMDAMEFFDINGDGKPELLVGQSDVGTVAYNAQNGDDAVAEPVRPFAADYGGVRSGQFEDAAGGDKWADVWSLRGPRRRPVRRLGSRCCRWGGGFRGQATPPGEIGVGGGGLGAQLYWFDNVGRLLETWPAHPLNGNPNFVRGDWFGTGKRTYFWFRFKLEPDGNSTLYFKGEVYHMFDFDHIGSDQVITLEGGGGGGPAGGGTQMLRVYGYAKAVPHAVKRDAEIIARRLSKSLAHY